MASHGGQRNGAGRPAGGVSQAKRLLLSALTRGLEIAGREKGFTGDATAVATETAAQLVADMVRLGRGDEVLKLLAVSQVKTDNPDDPGETALTRALRSMPGLNSPANVPQASRVDECDEHEPAQSSTYAQGATNPASVAPCFQPVFAPQSLLPLVHPAHVDDAARAGTGTRGGLWPGATPPSPPPRAPIALNAENFEKNQNAEPPL